MTFCEAGRGLLCDRRISARMVAGISIRGRGLRVDRYPPEYVNSAIGPVGPQDVEACGEDPEHRRFAERIHPLFCG